jgi:beta-glucuronidase
MLAVLICLVLRGNTGAAQTQIDLSGAGWTVAFPHDDRIHNVTVPHTWFSMEGYDHYLGLAIYQKDFEAPAVRPGQAVRLHFDAVFAIARVWVNGTYVGEHEGGYTAFAFDVTRLLKPGQNHLIVQVSNIPTLTTLPGLATAANKGLTTNPYGAVERLDMVGWLPYGGITRPVALIVSDAVYIQRLRVVAVPDLERHTARLTVTAFLHNTGEREVTAQPSGRAADLHFRFAPQRVPARGDAAFSWTATLARPHLWGLRDPFLYDASASLGTDTATTRFGIREVRVEGTHLLLNGNVVHLFGGNRVGEDPALGPLESPAIIHRDLSDMLAENMRMMRIAHYPQTSALLDFADAHGMLIIAEAGNWNLSAWQMDDPSVRSTWKQQMREMVEQDENHPSVIAWSMGNEYESATPQGIAWTRDMRQYTVAMDPTRLITFASRFNGNAAIKTGADEASQYCDFISVNIYGNYAATLDRIHSLWPDKPIFVSEFGSMGEPGLHDPKRCAEITTVVGVIKARPWVIGGSLWSWADYRSMYRGTPADGIRRWGTVTLDRQHRDSWSVTRDLFAVDLP